MKSLFPALILLAVWQAPLRAQEDDPVEAVKDILTRIEESSMTLAEAQDELSADVMELVEDQTVPDVIKLLEEVEKIMAEVTDELIEAETGGPTLAAQTEIIEKIFEAAKKKQQSSQKEGEGEDKEKQQGSQDSMGAMLDMMERMMGREPGDQEGPGEPQEGDNPGNSQGGGATGESHSANESTAGSSSGDTEERVIPKGGGPTGRALPSEFRKLLDAYNRNTSE